MSWVLVGAAGWLVIVAAVGLFAWALARATALGDRDQLEQLVPSGAVDVGAEARAHERRAGLEDRRTATRPWAGKAAGRRSEDALRKDLDDAHRALRDAEERNGGDRGLPVGLTGR